MRKYYTGIGSSNSKRSKAKKYNPPLYALEMAKEIGLKMAQKDWILRSGGATGMDMAFESKVPRNKKVIYKVDDFDFSSENYDFCRKEIESVIDKGYDLDGYSKYAQLLLLRDVNQILGCPSTNDFMVKSRFVICWTPHTDYTKADIGGTRFAIRIALKYDVPVFNLVSEIDRNRINHWLENE